MTSRTTLPPLRVSSAVRKRVEAALAHDETLSAFMLEAVLEKTQERAIEQEFIARGLASARKARASGKYFGPDEVLKELDQILARATRPARRKRK